MKGFAPTISCVAGAALLLTTSPATAEPLIFDNGRLFIRANVNGVETEALLDSASEATLIDPKLAKAAKLGEGQEINIRGSGGVAPARIVEGATLEAVGLELKPEAVVVTDLSELSTRLIKRPTQMVIGRELFDSARLEINIGQRRIARAQSGVSPRGRHLLLTAHAGVESVAVKVNGVAAKAEFDLGNGSEVLISRAVATRLKLKVTSKKAGGGIGGQVIRDLVVLRRLEVGGVEFRNQTAAIDDQPSANDLNIGTSILKSFEITTDFKQRSVWLHAVRKRSQIADTAASVGRSDIGVNWVGGPTMLLRFGPIRILTDPVLGEGSEAFRIYDPNVGKPDVAQARLAPLPKVPLDGLDLVLVSHSHEDHLDRTAIAKLGKQTEFLVPPSQLDDIRKRGVDRVSGLALGQMRIISRGDYRVIITAVAAQHTQQSKYLPILGAVNGYWLEFRRGSYRKTIYWTGDSFAPAGGIPASLRNPDLFIPHLGGVGASGPIGHVSMSWSHALAFARDLKPRAILPVHHSTFSLYREPIELFVDAAKAASFKVERLREGDEFRLK